MDAEAMSDDALVRRAVAAYYQPGSRRGHTAEQAIAPVSTSYTAEHLDKRYVVLEDFDGVLAVYRVRNDGILKALRRWPAEIEKGKMSYAFIVTADAPGVTTGQVRELSKVLAFAYSGDAKVDGSRLTARVKVPPRPPVFTADQAEFAARRYVTISAEMVGTEDLVNMQAGAR